MKEASPNRLHTMWSLLRHSGQGTTIKGLKRSIVAKLGEKRGQGWIGEAGDI